MGSMLLIFLVLCSVLLCVFTFWVPCCDVRYDFHIQTMFYSSLPPVVCRRAHVLYTRRVTLITRPSCYSYIQSSLVKVLAVIEERKHLHKSKRSIVIWDMDNIVLCFFVLVCLVFCVCLCCQFLWIIHFLLLLRYYLTFTVEIVTDITPRNSARRHIIEQHKKLKRCGPHQKTLGWTQALAKASYKTPAMLPIYTVKSDKSIGSDRLF
jgi:hypothetical protein